MELAELLEAEGLDGDEVLAWAKERVVELVSSLPEDMDLDGLLADMPKLEVIEGGTRPAPAETREAPPASDADLLGEEDEEFEALHTGSFEVVEEGAPEEEGSPYDTGPLPEASEPEAGAPEEEMEMVESGEIEEIEDIEEIEELDDEELMEFASGEYEMVEMDEDDEEEPSDASRPPAPPPSRAPDAEAVPDEVEDSDSFDLDLDM
jgi:hypothetical protein